MSANAKILTEAQIEAFHRDGFVFVPEFLDGAAMRQVLAWTEEVAAWPEVPGRHMVYYEDSLRQPDQRVVQRIEDFTPYHSGFQALFTTGAMAQAVAELLDEPATLFKEKINFKLPGGDGFKAHQDVQAGWSRYADFHLTALVSIDASTAANGCLEMAAGWHDKGLVGQEWTPLGEAELEGIEFKSFPTQPGDALFFDSFAPHRSGPNETDLPRRVLYVTYNRASAGDHRRQYFDEKRAAFPPDVERAPGETYTFRV